MSTGLYKADDILHDAIKAEGFNTVTFGDVSAVDLQKQSIYPLCHVTITDVAQTSSIQTISYFITILDLIDENNLNKRTSENKFRLTSNIEDVFHDLAYRFNRAYQTLKKDTTNVLDTSESISLTAGYAEMQNKLAGYTTTLDITIENSGIC
jgi:hypothetical protein